MQIVVSYEEASKNGDMSALTCFKPKNKYAFNMVVGAVRDEADEIFKIVSQQGYLKKHDIELLDKVAEAIKNGCTCTDYSCGVPFNKDCVNCKNNMIDYPSVMEVIAEMKEEVEK